MSDNANNRKKTLIISMLLFLLGGGGIFLFFIIQGSNDLTGAGKNNFQYGTATRGAVSSFFKVLGFNDNETLAVGPEKRPVPKSFLDKVQTSEDIGSKADESLDSWGGVKSKPSASQSVVPKMGARAMSGVGGGGGGSQSSGGVSRFGEGSESGNTRISAKTGTGGESASGKGTLGALQKANALLGSGLRSGSAMTAKSSWDRSFGVNAAGGGHSGDLAYGKSGLVKLDTIKKGEVENLKTTDIKSLKTPEPGAFKEDKDLESKDPTLNKAKEDAADAIKKSMAQAALSEAFNGITGTAADKPPVTSRGGADSEEGVSGLGNDGSCNMADGPQTSLCSKALSSAFPGEDVSYSKMGNNADGTLVKVSYSGTDHSQDAVVLMKKDGSIDFNWGDFKSK